MNGGQGKVIYIVIKINYILIYSNFNFYFLKDTEGNFRPERIEGIAERFGLGTK